MSHGRSRTILDHVIDFVGHVASIRVGLYGDYGASTTRRMVHYFHGHYSLNNVVGYFNFS